jgi:hypothetical protein
MDTKVKISELLSALKEVLPSLDVAQDRLPARGQSDLIIVVGTGRAERRLLVEIKSLGEPRYVGQAITALTLRQKRVSRSYGLVVAPYMGPQSRGLCREAGVGYLDLSGNAFLKFGGVYVERQSAERPRRERARLRRLFAPRSARIIRVMLEHPDDSWTLTRLAREASVSLRTAHLVVAALDEKAFVERPRGSIHLTKPGDLLDLWSESYRLDQHQERTFYSFTRDPREMARQLAVHASRLGLRTALTQHSGAALVAPFVRSADVHAYVLGDLDPLVKALDLRPVDAGGTVHLLTPNDEGVLYGTRSIEETPVVCNTQLYLDLVNFPARGREQAAELRRRALPF